jgi:hypothetical protein
MSQLVSSPANCLRACAPSARAMCLAFVAAFSCTCAFALEGGFGYATTADTLPAGGNDYSTLLTHRWDKTVGEYKANDLQLRWEHGVTDRLTSELAIEAFDLRAKNAFPLDAGGEEVYPLDIDVRKISAFKGALKYNFMSVYKDGFGLAVGIETLYRTWYPRVDGAKTKQFSLEPKLIVQKNFLDDQLVTVLNLSIESERRKFPDADAVENEFAIRWNGAANYRFAPNFFGGVEALRSSDVLNGVYNHYAFFFGPTATYGTEDVYITATYLRQLMGSPSYSLAAYPDGVDPVTSAGFDRDLHLEEDTKHEFRVKVGFNF